MKNRMKYLSVFISILLIAACADSDNTQQPKYENLTELSPPETQDYTQSKVYVDSVKIVDRENQKALLIYGNFSNGCTKLHKVSHSVENDYLQLSLTGWQPEGKMCSQALVPFSFIYEQVPQEQIESFETVNINGNSYSITE